LILKEPGLWRHTSSRLNREAQMTTAATHVMEIAALRVTSSMPIARSPRPTLGHAGLMPREPSARARSRAVSSAGMDDGTCSCGGQLSQKNAVRSSSEVIGAIGGLPFPPNCARLFPEPALPTSSPACPSKGQAGLSFAHGPASHPCPFGYAPADTAKTDGPED
jgi:hypothetical protein